MRIALALALLVMACQRPGDSVPGPGSEGAVRPSRDEPAESAGSAESPSESSASSLGEGFVVWESNRTGRWRLWVRDLEGGEPRQLTADEERRIHCCPHIAPDGESIVYLSLPPDQKLYPEGGAVGRMDWIRPDGTGRRTLLESARNYYENRAAVWRDPGELIFIEADGRTAMLELADGTRTVLTPEPSPETPWLISRQLRWAASGIGGFGEFERQTGRVALRSSLPGCQPYFSRDGRWVFWVQAPGGPLAYADLASGETGTLLKKSDPRLPEDRGYLYFPMLSSDGRLLAFGASPDEFNHFESDYEIFVVETDPDSLEILGEPLRVTDHPATDRFPDVWVSPLPLGRHQGEAPYRLQLEAPSPERSWRWSFGDGGSAEGAEVEHRFESPGRYDVQAESKDEVLRGLVVVKPARPPRVVSLSLLDGARRISVVFDEAVEIGGLATRLQSGPAIEEALLDENDRRLQLKLASPLEREDVLEISGVRDRAQRPNEMDTQRLDVELPVWPSRREGLVLLFQTANAPNLVYDAEMGADSAVLLQPRGRARLDHHFSLLPSGGFFAAAESDAARLVAGGKSTYELTVEAVLEPFEPGRGRAAVVLASGPARRLNFSLEQRGPRLVFVSRTRRSRSDPPSEVTLFPLRPGQPNHVVITYTPGQLRAYLDGEPIVSDTSLQKGFHHWRPAPLSVGAAVDGGAPWLGRAEGLAVYNRVLQPQEVRENFQRYREILESRPAIDSWRVRATQQRCSPVPALSEIQPYREALTVCTYAIEESSRGADLGARVRVALWSVLDGERLDLAAASGTGRPRELVLTRVRDNPQLESIYLSDTLADDSKLELFYAPVP